MKTGVIQFTIEKKSLRPNFAGLRMAYCPPGQAEQAVASARPLNRSE